MFSYFFNWLVLATLMLAQHNRKHLIKIFRVRVHVVVEEHTNHHCVHVHMNKVFVKWQNPFPPLPLLSQECQLLWTTSWTRCNASDCLPLCLIDMYPCLKGKGLSPQMFPGCPKGPLAGLLPLSLPFRHPVSEWLPVCKPITQCGVLCNFEPFYVIFSKN